MQSLLDMGFDYDTSTIALLECENDVERAITMLLGQSRVLDGFGGAAAAAAVPHAGADYPFTDAGSEIEASDLDDVSRAGDWRAPAAVSASLIDEYLVARGLRDDDDDSEDRDYDGEDVQGSSDDHFEAGDYVEEEEEEEEEEDEDEEYQDDEDQEDEAPRKARKSKKKQTPAAGATGGGKGGKGKGDSITTYVRLESRKGGSEKFYEVTTSDCTVIARYGKCGTAGSSAVKVLDDVVEALDYAATLVTLKKAKGYVECGGGGGGGGGGEGGGVGPVGTKRKTVRLSSKTPRTIIPVPKHAPPPGHLGVGVGGASAGSVGAYLEFSEGSSDKFYELKRRGCTVDVRYGRIGSSGVMSTRTFGSETEAVKFVDKTANEKRRKGYVDMKMPDDGGAGGGGAGGGGAKAAALMEGVDEDDEVKREKLERGERVYVKGGSAMPYTLKKFNGGYSCTCAGWVIQIKNKGVQATSCKHLKQIRGDDAEATRCKENVGLMNPSVKGKKDTSIPGKISLAQAWKPSTDPTGYIMSEKLDGMRAYWDGKRLYTRSGIPVLSPDWFTESLPEDLHLDGELFLGRKRFEDCMSITRRTDKSGDWHLITYVIFDAPTVKGGIMERLEAATAILGGTSSSSSSGSSSSSSSTSGAGDGKRTGNWKIHPHRVCTGAEDLLEELARIEALDGEGVMLRSAKALHRGGRSSDLLKVKSFHDDEALVLDHEKGKGKYVGMVGALVCVSRTGARFKVGSGLTDAQRVSARAPQPGQVITFKYFELTPDGIPRFPTYLRLRPDVSASEFPK